MTVKSHKTSRVCLKIGDIDRKIAPVVKWLNSFTDVSTYACCEGDPEDPKDSNSLLTGQPYVAFYCRSMYTLTRISKILKHCTYLGSFEVTYQDWEGIGFTIRFYDVKCLASFCKTLKSSGGKLD